MDNECLYCKNHHTQSGKCYENNKLCIHFKREPRGKRITKNFSLEINYDAESPLIKHDEYITCVSNGNDFECRIISINWLDMRNFTVGITAELFEYEIPKIMKKCNFTRIK